MKSTPLMFTAAMVRAIRAGTKTQTRRLVKGKALDCLKSDLVTPSWVAHPDNDYSPYGYAGDEIWTREACRAEELSDGQDGVRYRADDTWQAIANTEKAADDWLKMHTYRRHRGSPVGPWVPPIHVPRWASRDTLRLSRVAIEQLQNISPNDCIAEGVWPAADRTLGRGHEAVAAYQALWIQLHGVQSWDANPYVWVLEWQA